MEQNTSNIKAINKSYKKMAEPLDAEMLEEIKKDLLNGTSFPVLTEKYSLSDYDLGPYLELAFNQCHDIDIFKYVNKDVYIKITQVLKKMINPFLKPVKEEVLKVFPDLKFTYHDIRICSGVYYRTRRWYSTDKVKDGFIVNKIEDFTPVVKENSVVDLKTTGRFYEIINSISTPHWKTFATELFSKYTPKQFWIMPATLSKGAHNATELITGKFDEKNINKLAIMGGKAFHSLRVYDFIQTQIDADCAEITDKKGVVAEYCFGNEFEKWEEDMLKVAALAHDIFSGGFSDTWDENRKSLDIMHPYYHRKALLPIKHIIPDNEWNTFMLCIENHMWKWSPKPLTICFDMHKTLTEERKNGFFKTYRLVKMLQIADYFSAQREIGRGREIIDFINAHYLLTGKWELSIDEIENLEITNEDLIDSFGHNNIEAIIEVCKQLRKEKLKSK